jgi:hypothetical protein
MTRKRLLTLLLTLALALATAPAVLAQDESPAPEEGTETETTESTFDPASVEEWNEDEALILYSLLEDRLLAMGVAEEDMDEAAAYLQETYGDLDEEDIADLMEYAFASGFMDELSTEEEGETVDMGDEEFGQSEEEEPDIDSDIGDDEEEDD